ncbi:MAG: precorrin-6y C5,15-methyltransferase (decarboxylating) subunit CbiE [Gammaproteobacteria bacterium]|nr:precorrin-6y C5,15-methyltransferase (decarboxylating) subunit CbiE [Gammaproteobacteria bacterium]
MSAWLDVVGIGESGLEGLGARERGLVERAEVLVGGARHLAMVANQECEKIVWPSPFDALAKEIRARAGRRVCVLASGDPLCYGVGSTLRAHFTANEMVIHPSTSAFTLARARMRWSADEVTALSLHGRPIALIEGAIQPGARLLVLSHDGNTPAQVAARLTARGFGPSSVTVLEHLGGAHERIRTAAAAEFDLASVSQLNTIAVDCLPVAGARAYSLCPGLPDDVFEHDGQLSKRLVRAATVSSLCPLPEQLLWDVGAGCGSVAIEWMRAAPRTRAVAVERDPRRIAFIRTNAQALGTPGLVVIQGEASDVVGALAAPDAIFIGGGVSDARLFDTCWQALKFGGRLVANAVSIEGCAMLADMHRAKGGELHQLSFSQASAIGAYRAFVAARTVTQLVVVKQ